MTDAATRKGSTPMTAEEIAKGLTERDPVFEGSGDAYYEPPFTGLHLCGHAINPDDERHFEQAHTAASISLSEELARELFAVAKEVGECGKEEQDFVFDLFVGGDSIHDFWTSRQQMHNIRAAVRAILERKS